MDEINTDYLAIQELFTYYNQKPPNMESLGHKKALYEPRTHCRFFLPKRTEKSFDKCRALKRLYCKYEKDCDFYKFKGAANGENTECY